MITENNQLEIFNPERWPHKPYCTDWLENGLVIRKFETAIQKRYLQANPHSLIYRLVFDVDRPDAAMDWMGRGVAAPSWVAENPENEHAHLAYEIELPVCKTENARVNPLRYTAAIENAMADRLQADVGYSGLIVKNPSHTDWRFWQFRTEPYQLRELAEHVDLNTKKRKAITAENATGLGRNCILFDDLRLWAYCNVHKYRNNGEAVYLTWMKAVSDKAADINNQFSSTLPLSEIKATAKSVGKWTWTNFRGAEEHSPAFLAKQAARGRRKGKEKRESLLPKAKEMASKGASTREIADELEVNQSTIVRWLKR